MNKIKMSAVIFISVIAFIIAGCGTGNVKETRLKEGRNYLSSGEYLNAYDSYSKVLEEDPENCEANYGLLLSDTLMLIDQVNAILGLASGLGSTLSAAAGGMVDQIVAAFLMPFVELFDEMDSAAGVIERKDCTFNPGHIVIQIGTVDDPIVQVALIGQWDPPEAQLIGSMANAAKAILKLVLSVDLDIPLDPVLAIVQDSDSPLLQKINACDFTDLSSLFTTCDFAGIMRDLGFVMDLTSTFLTWHPDRAYMYTQASQELSAALRRVGEAIRGIFSEVNDSDDYDNVLYVYDKDRNGVFSGLKKDNLIINAYKVYPGGSTAETVIDESSRCLWLPSMGEDFCAEDLVEPLLYPLITTDYVNTVVSFMERWSKVFDVNTIESTGEEPEPIHPVEIMKLIPIDLGFALPDVIRVSPWRFFATSVTQDTAGPRDLLPYWGDLNGDGESEFVVEAEWPEGSTIPSSMTDYVFAGDASHYVKPITLPDGSPMGLTVPADCAYLTGEGVIVYMALQDPSYNGALEVNLSSLDLPCTNPCETEIASAADAEGWYSPVKPDEGSTCGIYAVNKVVGYFMSQLTSMLSSILSLLQ